LLTKGVRGEAMEWRVAGKSGWYLRFLEGVADVEESDCGGGEDGDDGDGGEDTVDEVNSGVSVGSVVEDSELDESQLDRRS
jgi:hypothetical protein